MLKLTKHSVKLLESHELSSATIGNCCRAGVNSPTRVRRYRQNQRFVPRTSRSSWMTLTNMSKPMFQEVASN